MSIDTEGYNLPSAIAFVPAPGKGPKDPLYFVTELRGKVKVVTNDRTVYTFAEVAQLLPKKELPAGEGQGGLAGICLEPEHGYVFVTFMYQDSGGVLRNNIIRFQSEPKTFSIRPGSQLAFTEVFSSYEAGLAHQIGHCQIKDGLLYVSIGDGWKPFQSQKTDSILGKVIRTTLDGKPVPQNPFYQDGDVKKAANYVWAYGLRNPFGLKIVDGRVFAAENGLSVDRFLEICEGQNYLWDGSDWSIATNADFVFPQSAAPVQVDYYPEGSSVFPQQYEQNFFVALAGIINEPGPGPQGKVKGVVSFKYGLRENKVLSVPKYLLKYCGSGYQAVVGVGFGPDGLYVVPLFPNEEGRSAVFKVTYNPAHEHPFLIEESDGPKSLLKTKSCLGCHTVDGLGVGGTAGPHLGGREMVTRIQARVNSEEYLQSLREMNLSNGKPSYREARNEVIAAKGRDRVRVWVKNRIMEPRFDNPSAQMPNLGVPEKDALILADFLLKHKSETLKSKVLHLLPAPLTHEYSKYLILSFIGGVFIGGSVLTLSWLTLRRINKQK